MSIFDGPKVVTDNLIFTYDMGNSKSMLGQPTTNVLPSPAINGRFTTANEWGTYNTNQYNSGSYFSIGTVSSVSGNIVTTSGSHPFRTYDAVTPQTTGGGVTAGTNYFVKSISSTQFSLHEYNSTENGSQGYINPATGLRKVHDSIGLDQRISINSTNFPTMWWGYPHLPNTCHVKEVVEGGGYEPGTNSMRIHVTRTVGVDGGMAYGVYTPVTVGDNITVSYWLRTNISSNPIMYYTTYFGPDKSAFSDTITVTQTWKRIVHSWTASATFNFYQYFFPSAAVVPYFVEMADLQVELNKGGIASPFTTGTRSNTQTLRDISGRGGTITANSLTYANDNTFSFNGSSNYITFTPTATFNLYCFSIWYYNNNAIPNNDTAIGGPSTYQTLVQFNGEYPCGVNLGAWSGSITNEAIHLWTGTAASYNITYNRDYVASGWHNTVFNWNGTTYDIWTDGVKTTTYVWTGAGAGLQSISNMQIGYSSPGYYFNGKIANFQCWAAQLTDSQVLQNFNALRGRFGI